MSFNVVTALWIGKIFILYTLMVVVLPYFVMRSFLKGRSLSQKFLICVVAGNFFYIMLVLLWGLLHITNRYVLIGTTLVLPVMLIVKNSRRIWEKYLKQIWIHLCRFLKRENSFRYTIRIFIRWGRKKLRIAGKKLWKLFQKNWGELILFIGSSLFVIWYFSITDHFGPRASDLTVHMYWINEVDNGNIFCDGIYPFGMHAMLYYLHAVFGISTARLVLLFGPVQTFYIFTMLLVFLKEICRYRYTPYLSYIAYAVGDYLVNSRYSRFYSTLPQEFGMIFLLPCGVALIRFFRAIKEEDEEYKRMKEQKLLYTRIDGKHKWRESTIQLWILIISFGLTLSAHFYITIIVGLLVAAAAVAYVRFVLKPKVFRKLVVAAIISILIPVFPMAVAFAGGTPLQGSLYWALSVMGIERSDIDTQEESVDEKEREELSVTPAAEETIASDSEQGTVDTTLPEEVQDTRPLSERVTQYIETVKNTAVRSLTSLIFNSQKTFYIWLCFMLAMIIEIPLLWIFREWENSRYLIMILLFTGFMILLSISAGIGLPTLIDENRSTIFFCYTILIGVSLAVDGGMIVLNHIIGGKKIWQGLSLGLAFLFAGYSVASGNVRIKQTSTSSLERDGAALCTFDIMEKYPDEKWTIVSCNEERNYVSPVAWHYETVDFLQSMENYEEDDEMYIPTLYVFFFIEKESLDYAYGEFSDIDATVSEKWASEPLPAKNGLTQYSSTNRIILNSRMYYWALEYQKRFPNEMKVYYEDEDFICFYIEQNEYYLNNFAIDYGYNSGG